MESLPNHHGSSDVPALRNADLAPCRGARHATDQCPISEKLCDGCAHSDECTAGNDPHRWPPQHEDGRGRGHEDDPRHR